MTPAALGAALRRAIPLPATDARFAALLERLRAAQRQPPTETNERDGL